MTEILTALQSTDGLIALGLFIAAIVGFAIFALKFKNPYLAVFSIICLIAGSIMLLVASGVIVVDLAAWNAAPTVTPVV